MELLVVVGRHGVEERMKRQGSVSKQREMEE
jgi:hypothetical protein